MNTIFQILKSDVNYFWIILSMVIATFSHIARAFRWRLQLRALNITPSMRVLINAIFGTYAMNLLFPRLGEVWRCGYVAQREKASFTKVLGSMVSDRLSDTIMLAMLTFAVFMIQMKPFRQFLNENPSIETGAMNVLTSVWLYVGIFICIVAVVWFQHLGRFCLDYYDEGEILVRILYPVYLVLLFYATVCLHIRFPRYGRFDGLGGLVTLCIG